jgi:hypothetical protein
MKNYILILLGLIALVACNNSSSETQQAPQDTTATAPVQEAAPDVMTLIKGKWQAVEDANSVVEISDATFTLFYEGAKMETRQFTYVSDCKSDACPNAGSEYGCFTSAGEFDVECYTIVSVSETDLEVSLAGGTGQSLTYKKVN